jgi:hypothetical protein
MSCLFNSLNYFIQEENSSQIRQKICDYLQENKPIMDGLETNTILSFENPVPSKYIESMRLMSTWGGAIEIQSACNIWKLRIIVNNHRNFGAPDIEFIPVNSVYDKTIHIYWNGGHYEPIRN